MRILVATAQMQGQRDNDFNWCDEGELVAFDGFDCDGGSVDDNCGCRRAMGGLRTYRATTTIRVAESDLTKNEYISHIIDAKNKQGWKGDIDRWMPQIDVLLSIAKGYPVDTILERRGNVIQPRQKMVDWVQLQMEA